jgi:hypothetical protein
MEELWLAKQAAKLLTPPGVHLLFDSYHWS